MKNTTETIDVTPTWEGLLPTLLHLVRNSKYVNQNPTVRQDIEQEFRHMAQAADKWNAHCKEMR